MLTKQDLNIVNVASFDKTRETINAVSFEVKDRINKNGGAFNSKAGYELIVVATDGYILTKKIIAMIEKPKFDKILIPANDIIKVIKLMNNKDTVDITDDKFIIRNKLGEFIMELKINFLDREYPAYNTLIPNNNVVGSLVINAKYLIESLKQVQAFSDTCTIEIFDQTNGIKPLVIKSSKDYVETTSLVMPLRNK